MDSGSNDITFNTEIYFQYQPQIQLPITRNDARKLIFVKLFSVSQNAHCDTEVEKIFFCSTLSEFENFLLCERILINVTTCQNETSS
jgi:hypothetical protein